MTFDKIFTALNVIFTGLSVVAAFFALQHSRRTERKSQLIQDRQLEIENRLLQIEEARERERLEQSQEANLVPRLEKLGSNSYRFSIENRGQGIAADINIRFDNDKPPSAYHFFAQQQIPTYLDGGRSYSVKLQPNQAVLPQRIEITWVNESGERKLSEDNLIWS